MSRSRDDFSKLTKTALALRASYFCSKCKCSTVGPSDEKPDAVTSIGIAAHICAAASGPGARRYDPKMTPQERSHISNGIWLCSNCAVEIDRDEVRFSADILRKMRNDHEASRRVGGNDNRGEGDLLAVGPGIVAVGHIIGAGPSGTRARISHFVEGSGRDLLTFSDSFNRLPPESRYVLMNELGYGGLLDGAPVIERIGNAYEIQFRFQESAPRSDASANISGICRHTGRMISGMDVFIQHFEYVLGLGRGTWFAELESGSDLADLFWRYHSSPWFERLAMLEMVRLACIPQDRKGERQNPTPLSCVNRILNVTVPAFNLNDQKLAIDVEFDIEGLGRWSRQLKILVPTPEQLMASRANATLHSEQIKRIEATGSLAAVVPPRR